MYFDVQIGPRLDVINCRNGRGVTFIVQMTAVLLLAKCYDRKKVKSLFSLTIIPVAGSEGGKPTKKYFNQLSGVRSTQKLVEKHNN